MITQGQEYKTQHAGIRIYNASSCRQKKCLLWLYGNSFLVQQPDLCVIHVCLFVFACGQTVVCIFLMRFRALSFFSICHKQVALPFR